MTAGFSLVTGGREAFKKHEMKNLRIIILSFILTFSAFILKAQGPTPNITDDRLDFTVAGIKGDSIKLSSLKGKVLILDFWASWCKPCRYSNKDLTKLYSKYKAKGLEILSVSLDDEMKEWKKAVAKDKIKWLQGVDPAAFDGMSAIKWQVDAIPSTFLVNKDGDVVLINPEKDDLEKKIKELLGL
jgi:thiol-disulfide isomerase/thioredoxin